MSYRIGRDWRDRMKRAVPFGLGQTNPKHFRDIGRVVWDNRDNLGYAWKVLNKGVCDGCALGVAGLHDWTIDGVHLCMTRLNLLRLNTMPAFDPELLRDAGRMGSMSNEELRGLGRLAYPMWRARSDPGFRRISWEEAVGRIASRIQKSDPRRIAFYLTSRALTNEVYYTAQKVARFLGTNNIDNAARLCHSPSTGAMRAALGVAASTCSYKDWWDAQVIVFFGSNPANDQPVSIKYLHECKRRGAKVVMVNPYREPGMDRYWVPSVASSALWGTDIMDYWFPVAQGGDIAFLYGVIKSLSENGWTHQEFVRDHTAGFDALRQAAVDCDWKRLERDSGISRAGMEEFAALLRDAERAVFIWSMGITQHRHGGSAVQMILNAGLTRGYVGKNGCGLMPIRGHSGVQGGAEMGAYATAFPGGQPVNAGNAKRLEDAYGFPVPDTPGLTAPEMIEAAARGELDLLYSLGGNLLRALPDPAYVAGALRRLPMRVHQDIILTDQMFLDAEEEVILLPAKTRYEQEGGGAETTTERRIAFSPEIARQVGEARAEWKILRDVAATAYPVRAYHLGCRSAQEIREEIAEIVPAYEGIQDLKKSGDAIQYGGRHLCADWNFPTPDGKAHFIPVELPDLTRPEGVFHVSTRRGKQFNTIVYAETDPLTGAARDAVFMSAADAEGMRLNQGDSVALVNEQGRFEGHVFLAAIAPGNLQVHWPEGNVLLAAGVTDSMGGVPDYNALARVEKL